MRRYKVREIAQQCGLSEATVDRVLNNRAGVRENTRAEVMQAIADLDKQRAQLRLNGRRFLIDVVMQTPQRFSDAFRAAVEAELPAFAPAALRARFHLWESGSSAQTVDVLSRIRGSHGVILKAQDEPEVADAVDRLVAGGVPVVTYTTDVANSDRCAYVGIDNHGAGMTAAYLVEQWLGAAPGDVLITLSRSVFRGEGEREVGFRAGWRVRPADRRGQRGGRDRRQHRGAGARCAEPVPGHHRRVLARRRHTGHGGGVRAFGRSAGCSWPTTWTPTTAGCCVPASCRWSCTTICAPTPGWPCG
jgi:hypothetical protein